MDWVTFAFGGGIKTQKSPSAYVWDHRFCLGCRMTILFVSTDRYDPKDTCKHTSAQLAPDNPPSATLVQKQGGYLEKILRTKVHDKNKINVKIHLCPLQTFFCLSCPVYNINNGMPFLKCVYTYVFNVGCKEWLMMDTELKK